MAYHSRLLPVGDVQFNFSIKILQLKKCTGVVTGRTAQKTDIYIRFRRVLSPLTYTIGMKSGHFAISVLNVDQVPADLREVAILRGYRTPTNSPSQCIASIFHATNETFNFWTHFLPTWYFTYWLAQLIRTVNVTEDEFSLPFLCFMITICVYPLISCVAHVFSSLSHTARHICYFCDYGALSLYSYGTAVLYRSYSLPDRLLTDGLANIHLVSCFLSSAISTLVACFSRFTDDIWLSQGLRVSAYAVPYLFGGFPLLCRVIMCYVQGDKCIMPSFWHHVCHFVAAFSGAFVYSTHLPERIWPGRFDIIGHSHQWLHICSIVTTNEQIMAALVDMQQRQIGSNNLSACTLSKLDEISQKGGHICDQKMTKF
uniref:Uncharacterized protein n=1 Tax=Strigamia maritima TaxID=126957 RepID=T1J160_STRMM